MSEFVAGIGIPETAAVADATRLVRGTTKPLICHHSRRVFLLGMLEHRPETTDGTLSADVLEHFIPGFRRTTMVERVINAPRLT
jgi:hypothetical protein